MNIDKMKQYVLLAHSGELPARKMEKLKKALAASPALRAFARELDQASTWMKTFKIEHQPGAETLHTIHQTATGRIPRRPAAGPRMPRPHIPAIPWAVAAALLLLCLFGARLLLHEGPHTAARTARTPDAYMKWDTSLDEELDAFEMRIVSLREDWPRNAEWSAPDHEDDTESIAEELLRWEGVEI